MKQEERQVPIKSYSKSELAQLYGISAGILRTWLRKWEKQLKALGYDHNQKVFTVAQVRYLFRDDVLGQP